MGEAVFAVAATPHTEPPVDSLVPIFAAPDRLALVGLRMGFCPLATDIADTLAGSVAAAFFGTTRAHQLRARATCSRLSSKSMIWAWIRWPTETTSVGWLIRYEASLLTWMTPCTPSPRST